MKRALNELSIPELERLLVASIEEMEAAGKAWAEGKAFYESIDDKKRPTLALLMARFEGSNPVKETKALATEDYENYLELLAKSRLDYYRSQVIYDVAKNKIDALRTIISARKVEVQKFGG